MLVINLGEMTDNSSTQGSESHRIEESFPSYVDMELTARCNLDCGFCFGPEQDSQVSDLPHDFWENTLRSVKGYGAKGVVFGGGEPALYSTIVDLLREASDLELHVILSTNGTVRNKVLECAEWTDWIALPIDGYNTETQIAMRGHSGGIEYIHTLIREIKDMHPDVSIKLGTVATSQNLDDVPLIGLALRDEEVPIETWKIYQYTPRRKSKKRASEFLITDEIYANLHDDILKTVEEAPFQIVFSSNQSRERAYLFVYPDGSLIVPNVGKEMGDHYLGNLFSEGQSLLERVSGVNHTHNVTNYTSTYRD